MSLSECEQCEERKAQAPAVLIPAKGRPQWNPNYTGPLQGVFYAMPPCPEEGAYHTACDSLEAAISARVEADKEPGPQGSLVEAIEWAYRRLDMLEAAAEGAVSLAVENEQLKTTMRNLPEVKVFDQIMTERIDGINRQLLREHTLLLKALKSVQGMCTGAIRSRIDKVITECEAHG